MTGSSEQSGQKSVAFFRKGHKYLTLVNDLTHNRVLYVAEGREQKSLDGFWPTLTEEQRDSIAAVAMDMWDPYVASVREHVAQSARTRSCSTNFTSPSTWEKRWTECARREHKQLKAEGDDRLTGTKYDWLRNPAALKGEQRREFAQLRQSELKTARA